MATDSSGAAAEHIANAELVAYPGAGLSAMQADGAPEGKSEEYWHRARTLIEDEAKSRTSPDDGQLPMTA